MPYLQQQQQPGPIPAFDELEQRVHPFTGPILAAVFAIGGFFFGLNHPRYPLVLFIGAGLVIGLLFVGLLKHLATFLVLAALVGTAGVGTFWLFEHTAELQRQHQAPAAQSAPASPAKAAPQSLLNDLRKAVQ